MTGSQVKNCHLVLMNHHDPVMAGHQVGGDGGRVAIAGTTARGVPGFKGDTVTSPADLPHYAPIIAKYTGVLAATDIEAFTTTTTFQIMQSYRLDRGHSGSVHP